MRGSASCRTNFPGRMPGNHTQDGCAPQGHNCPPQQRHAVSGGVGSIPLPSHFCHRRREKRQTTSPPFPILRIPAGQRPLRMVYSKCTFPVERVMPAPESTSHGIDGVKGCFQDSLSMLAQFLSDCLHPSGDKNGLRVKDKPIAAQPVVGLFVGNLDEVPSLQKLRQPLHKGFPAIFAKSKGDSPLILTFQPPRF